MQFDRAKLEALILYACAECDPSSMGAVKLHKVLYFADMLYFAETGSPITGATYRKRPHGPTCDELLPAIRRLEESGKIVVRQVDYFGYVKKEFIPKESPDPGRLKDDEVRLIDEVIDFVCNQNTAKTISEYSHNKAWEIAEFGAVMPYHSVLSIFPNQASSQALEWAACEAEKIEKAKSKRDTVGLKDFGAFRSSLSTP